MLASVRTAIVSLLVLTVITGVIYPLVVTGIAKAMFADKASGSVIVRDGRAVGSELIAQRFDDPKYFWPRPSAANYDAAAGAGSNLGPSNPALRGAVQQSVVRLRMTDPASHLPVPVDLVTASASGLDPHISPAAAAYQAHRVAAARGMRESDVQELIRQFTQSRTFGILGEPRVNVLLLNLALDKR